MKKPTLRELLEVEDSGRVLAKPKPDTTPVRRAIIEGFGPGQDIILTQGESLRTEWTKPFGLEGPAQYQIWWDVEGGESTLLVQAQMSINDVGYNPDDPPTMFTYAEL